MIASEYFNSYCNIALDDNFKKIEIHILRPVLIVQKSSDKFLSSKYEYGIVPYPFIPQSFPHELRIRNCFFESLYPTHNTACPSLVALSFLFGSGMIPVLVTFGVRLMYTENPKTNGYPSAKQDFISSNVFIR